MSTPAPSLFSRPDTLLGVCEGLGDDFGINPLWLRIAFALTIFWSPLLALAVYLGLGVAVLVSRLAFPPRPASVLAAAPPVADNDAHAQPLARAA